MGLQRKLGKIPVGGKGMKKDEILSASRKEKNDEYEAKTLKDAQTFGITVVAASCILLLVANAIASDFKGLEEGIVSFDYAAILCAYVSGINFFAFKKLRNRYYAVAGFAFCFCCVCALVLYFMNL
jgi:hypothetical protein